MLQKYLITSREFYTDTPAVFRAILHKQFVKHLPDYALYRDKSNPNYATQAEHFVEVCAQFEGIKAIIHQDYLLASQLNAYGVHLTSQEFDKIAEAKRLGLFVIVSTHTQEELRAAEQAGADCVTYSPIFATPNKGEPKGIAALERVVANTTLKVFALGGIVSEHEVTAVGKSAAYGFASIRYFY
jgi:thiamine-phosphate pyrophosphorylase